MRATGGGTTASLPRTPHTVALLRLRREWPCCRAAEASDEFPPSKANAHLPLPSPMGAVSRQDSTSEACGPRTRSLPRTRPGGEGARARQPGVTRQSHPVSHAEPFGIRT
jgi:hypothetical protein